LSTSRRAGQQRMAAVLFVPLRAVGARRARTLCSASALSRHMG